MTDLLTDIGLYHYLLTALILFITGFCGIIISKNLLKILISLEIMFCGVTLNLAAFTVFCDEQHMKGVILAIFIILLTTVQITIGITIAINIFYRKSTLNIDNIGDLKG